MRHYEVEFSERAINDLDSSFVWGCENWGASAAAKWYFDLRDQINDRLSSVPLSCPPLEKAGPEKRILVIGRYNVIFQVNAKIVTILHIRGPLTER